MKDPKLEMMEKVITESIATYSNCWLYTDAGIILENLNAEYMNDKIRKTLIVELMGKLDDYIYSDYCYSLLIPTHWLANINHTRDSDSEFMRQVGVKLFKNAVKIKKWQSKCTIDNIDKKAYEQLYDLLDKSWNNVNPNQFDCFATYTHYRFRFVENLTRIILINESWKLVFEMITKQ